MYDDYSYIMQEGNAYEVADGIARVNDAEANEAFNDSLKDDG